MPLWTLPPIRYDSEPMSLLALAERVDWGLRLTGVQDLHAAGHKGKGVRVGICDTGAPQHVDLPTPVAVKNFTDSPTDYDRNGHMTHVCGTIGARANGDGVLGVAPECEMVYAKVLGDSGSGSNTWIANGIRFCVDQGCDVINLSLGGGGPDQQSLDAINHALDNDCLVIAAAGNAGHGGGNTIGYPGKLKETICVAAYREDGNIAQFSSGGVELDVAAPGEKILSTYLGNQYRELSGTSMATPFVVGVTALMIAASDDPITLASYRDIIKTHARDKGQTGHDRLWGWGAIAPGDFVDVVDDGTDPDLWLWI